MDRKVHKDVRDGVAKSFAIPWLESRKQFFIDARHRVVDSDRRQSELNGVGKTGKRMKRMPFRLTGWNLQLMRKAGSISARGMV